MSSWPLALFCFSELMSMQISCGVEGCRYVEGGQAFLSKHTSYRD